MINLLPMGRVIAAVSATYAIVTCAVLWFTYESSMSLYSAISVSMGGSAALHLVIAGFFFAGWRRVWAQFPSLNRLLFPDLNGIWDMVVYWHWEGKEGQSRATVSINQTFLTIGMDVEADDSDSQTLLAKPRKDPETGRPVLYYVYLTTPRNTSSTEETAPYNGAAILKLGLDGTDMLRGNYFTTRKSVGHYVLTRASI